MPRFAIRNMRARDITCGSRVLGVMLLVAFIEAISEKILILGMPACALYHKTTVLVRAFLRVLAGQRIGLTDLLQHAPHIYMTRK